LAAADWPYSKFGATIAQRLTLRSLIASTSN
jgi:hypothetical protein